VTFSKTTNVCFWPLGTWVSALRMSACGGNEHDILWRECLLLTKADIPEIVDQCPLSGVKRT